jgi:hypothetical protein
MNSNLEVSDFWKSYNSLAQEDRETISEAYYFPKDQENLSEKGNNLVWECYHLIHPKKSA